MNIFYLSNDPTECAQQHCDKHVVKMILEYAQLLSTAHRVLDGRQVQGFTQTGRKAKRYVLDDDRDQIMYQATHINHPDAVWARESEGNYIWLYKLFCALSAEYTHRYGRTHATYEKLVDELKAVPANMPRGSFNEPPQAMIDECKDPDVVTAYRNYYNTAKKAFLTWKNRQVPSWVRSGNESV